MSVLFWVKKAFSAIGIFLILILDARTAHLGFSATDPFSHLI